MVYIVILIVSVILVLIFRPKHKKMGELGEHWNHYFSNLQFSTEEFYALVEANIKVQAMPGVKISRVNYAETNILSDKREYLRVERKDDLFDICAAPFGAGFFVSYWLGKPTHAIRDLALKIPYLSTAVEGWQGSTYYVIDTACMFRGSVINCIKDAIEEITTIKGIRGLSEGEQIAMNK
jgi:hypothetical protein